MGQYSFATNLKKERTNRGITQHELATGVHVAQNTVSDWEQCKSYPSIDKIYDIANFLKIPVSKLIWLIDMDSRWVHTTFIVPVFLSKPS